VWSVPRQARTGCRSTWASGHSSGACVLAAAVAGIYLCAGHEMLSSATAAASRLALDWESAFAKGSAHPFFPPLLPSGCPRERAASDCMLPMCMLRCVLCGLLWIGPRLKDGDLTEIQPCNICSFKKYRDNRHTRSCQTLRMDAACRSVSARSYTIEVSEDGKSGWKRVYRTTNASGKQRSPKHIVHDVLLGA
jgi:hypothetical protein